MTMRSRIHFCNHLFLFLLFISLRASFADDAPLQDTCPAVPLAEKPHVFINGLPCKNPNNITSSDFKSPGLTQPGDTANFLRSSETILTAAEFPGLNTLGLAVGRTDLGPEGVVLPHAHPRASEMLYVTQGAVLVGFVDSGGRLFEAVVGEGDVFVFPRGLLHFCINTGYGHTATAISVFNSQSPGMANIADGLFVSDAGVAQTIVSRLMGLGGVRGMGYAAGSGTVGGEYYGDLLNPFGGYGHHIGE